MGCWGFDVYSDDDALAYIRDVLIAAGLLPPGSHTDHQVLYVSVHGRPLVCRLTGDSIRDILQALDTRLTPALLLGARRSICSIPEREVLGGGRASEDFLLPLLYMHVGAPVNANDRDWSLKCFSNRGAWVNTPARAKIAAVVTRELKNYDAAAQSGRVRFPSEMWPDFGPGGSRYFTYGPNSGMETPLSAWEVNVEHECMQCKRLAAKLMQCSVCQRTCYCTQACQKEHWKSHKPVCKAASK